MIFQYVKNNDSLFFKVAIVIFCTQEIIVIFYVFIFTFRPKYKLKVFRYILQKLTSNRILLNDPLSNFNTPTFVACKKSTALMPRLHNSGIFSSDLIFNPNIMINTEIHGLPFKSCLFFKSLSHHCSSSNLHNIKIWKCLTLFYRYDSLDDIADTV